MKKAAFTNKRMRIRIRKRFERGIFAL